MKNIIIGVSLIFFLSACGGSPVSNSDPLEGGTVDNPKELQFNQEYIIKSELGKRYVKVKVKKYQRITISEIIDKDCLAKEPFSPAYGGGGAPKLIEVYDDSLSTIIFARGSLYSSPYKKKTATEDIIFLKDGTYIFEYDFTCGSYRDLKKDVQATKALLTATNLGTTSLSTIEAGKTYKCYYGAFYLLKTEQNSNVKFDNGHGILYDENLNIVDDSISSNSNDYNLTLSRGNYFFKPTSRSIEVTITP